MFMTDIIKLLADYKIIVKLENYWLIIKLLADYKFTNKKRL